jgi:hypothetical protein
MTSLTAHPYVVVAEQLWKQEQLGGANLAPRRRRPLRRPRWRLPRWQRPQSPLVTVRSGPRPAGLRSLP